MLENPVITCAIRRENQLVLAIIDGHHRYRYAGLYGINNIPCIVCTPETLSEIINSDKENKKKISFDSFIRDINESITSTILSFNEFGLDYAPPIPIPDTTDIALLKNKFKSF